MKNEPIVWPIPQEITLREETLPLHDVVLQLPTQPGPHDEALARLLQEMVMDDYLITIPILHGSVPAGKCPIRIEIGGQDGRVLPPELPGAEGYLLQVTAEGVTAMGRDKRGAQYALATLLQLTEKRGNDVVLRGAEIRDWPHKPVRMVHLFLPGTENLAYARRYLRDFLFRYKFNGLFLETAGGVRFPRRPEIAAGARKFGLDLRAVGDTSPIYGENVLLGPNGRYADSSHYRLADGAYLEPDDLRHLCEWARALDLDVVPEVQSLAHVYYLATVYREIAELQEADFPDAYCPSNPKTYEILFDVMSDVIELTGCKSIHIGHDEWRAGGLCPRCSQRDAGELLAEDVLKITRWLRARNQGIWMWADHLIPQHDAKGQDSRGGVVWYHFPQTMKAAGILQREAPDIIMVNWSHWLGAEVADNVISDLGFKQIYGNFGPYFKDWESRSSHSSVLGGEISSWVAWDDHELGTHHYPQAMAAANLLWSSHYPEAKVMKPAVSSRLQPLRDRFRRDWRAPRLWSEVVGSHRMQPLDISQAANAPAKSELWDLSGLQAGDHTHAGVLCSLLDPGKKDGKIGVLVERRHKPAQEYPHDACALPVNAVFGSMIFWQTAIVEGGRPKIVGECSVFPQEWWHLLGWYEILFEDGLTQQAEIRFDYNLRDWKDGYGPLYHAREIQAGTLPDGSPLVIWGLEWTNPRPAVKIISVTMKGAGATPYTRALGDSFDTRPMLLGITGVELPKWIDYKPEREGKLPGLEFLIPEPGTQLKLHE